MGRKRKEPTTLVRLKRSDIKRLREIANKKQVSIGTVVRSLMRRS